MENILSETMKLEAIKKARDIDSKRFPFVKTMDIVQYRQFRDRVNEEVNNLANTKIAECIPLKAKVMNGDELAKMLFENKKDVIGELSKFGYNQFRDKLLKNMLEKGIWKKRL